MTAKNKCETSGKLIPLSWSRISVYRQCPKQFEAKYISKTYPDEGDNPAFEKGTRVHKQLEEYINWKKGVGEEPVMGKEASNAINIINSFFDYLPESSINAEKQVAINHDWESCDWFANVKTVKFRGILDMIVFKDAENVIIIDFKTGKVRPYSEDNGQLHLSSAMIFELFPEVQNIDNVYLFVEHKQSDTTKFARADHAKIKAHFDVEYAIINEDKEFEPKKNKYCYFCGIKEECKYG